MTLEIKAKIGESGKIFGKVTTLQISDALAVKVSILTERKSLSICLFKVPVNSKLKLIFTEK
jgi:large subunit ribosomal protein L9